MKIPFKVLATSTLALMLVACNNNDNAAFDALNPGDNNNTTNVANRRGDNLGDAFERRNGNDTGETINTRNVGNRTGNDNNDNGNDDNDLFDFTYDNNDPDWFGNGNGNGNNNNNNNGFLGLGDNDNNGRTGRNNNQNDRGRAPIAGLMGNTGDDNISADFTTMSSGKFPHTQAIRIQDAKYGYVVRSQQGGGQNVSIPELRSITEQYAQRFQQQFAQGGQQGQTGQQGNTGNRGTTTSMTGTTGAGGQAGTTGNRGTTGMTGTAGAGGQAGTTGTTGNRGTTGMTGTTGTGGQARTTGITGNRGTTGTTGTTGQTAKRPTTTTQQPARTTQTTAGISATEQQVIDLTNAERRRAGLKDLVGDSKLSSVARTKSNDMQKNGYFSHTSPTYGSPFDMMRDFGVTYKTAGENIAQGQRTPEEVVRAWMNSEGHRKNIMNPAFTHIGVGHDTTGNHWTQMFIGK